MLKIRIKEKDKPIIFNVVYSTVHTSGVAHDEMKSTCSCLSLTTESRTANGAESDQRTKDMREHVLVEDGRERRNSPQPKYQYINGNSAVG